LEKELTAIEYLGYDFPEYPIYPYILTLPCCSWKAQASGLGSSVKPEAAIGKTTRQFL